MADDEEGQHDAFMHRWLVRITAAVIDVYVDK
jgi:hypothetical protein